MKYVNFTLIIIINKQDKEKEFPTFCQYIQLGQHTIADYITK